MSYLDHIAAAAAAAMVRDDAGVLTAGAATDRLTLGAGGAISLDTAVAISDTARALQAALMRYSADRPRERVNLPTMTGPTRMLDLPLDWLVHWSAVLSVEHPIDRSPPCFLEPSAYRVIGAASDSGPSRLVLGSPIETAPRVRYTTAHAIGWDPDASPALDVDTVAPIDREALACWAAAELLDQLAARGAGTIGSTIGADAVDYEGQAGRYRKLARARRDLYYELMGAGARDEAAAGDGASTAVALQPRRLSGGGPRLTH